MKTLIGIGIIASLFGCVADEAEPTVDVVYKGKQCPDETCGTGNGAGIYTDENGWASIDKTVDAMLVRLDPVAGGMHADVRVKQADGTFKVETFNASEARIGSSTFTLTGMDESLTLPTFHFANHADVVGDAIANLSIVLRPISGLSRIVYTATFMFPKTEDMLDPNSTAKLHKYFVRMNVGVGYNANTWYPYCKTAAGDPDPIVFQRDIWVNAASSEIVRSDGTMTFSCRSGGIATARWWGYIYRNSIAQMNLFATAVHMKRASYCGDGSFWTTSGTQITFRDTAGINQMTVCPNPEAFWGFDAASGTFRALCYNQANLRNHNAFGGHCADGTVIPPCNQTCDYPGAVLADRWLQSP